MAVLSHRLVTAYRMNREPIGMWIFAYEAKEDAIVAHDNAYFGFVWSGDARFRGLLG